MNEKGNELEEDKLLQLSFYPACRLFSFFFLTMYLLSSAYLAPIHYYTKLIGDRLVVEERCEHYVKQTYRNRCLIATPDGILPLTIPVEGRPKSEGGTSKTPMRDIRISQHGRWRDLHWNALVSAYENSPFFQYYADDFWEIYRRPHAFLVDFNEALQHLVLDLLNYRPSLSVNLDGYIDARALGDSVADFRETIHPKRSFAFDSSFRIVPYYQVFAARTGFLPNLSVVDLLFNMGSESRIVLRQSLVASVSSSAPAVVER